MKNTDNKLQVIIQDSGLEATKAKVLLENFKSYFDIAEEWEIKAKSLVVTNETQLAEMGMARVGRLFLREKRLAIEKTRKALKEQSLRESRAIDGIANVLKAVIVPIEEYLSKQEKFVQIRDAEIAKRKRIEANQLLAEKEEAERIAKEKAEAEEHERIRKENEKLKAEAIEREKQAEIESKRQAKILADQEAKAEAARKIVEEKNRIEREKQQRLFKKQRKQDEIERKKQAKIESDKREELRLKAIEERRKIEEKNRQEQIERNRLVEIERRKQAEILKIEKVKQNKLAAEMEKLKNQIECPKCHFKFTIVKKFKNELTLL